MKKLLLLGSSYGCTEMLRYAKSQGIHTIATDYLEPEYSIAKRHSDEQWMISTADVEQLAEKCRAEGVDAVTSAISEFNLERAMEVSEKLGTPWYCTKEAWAFGRNKRAFKDACKEVGAPVAKDFYVSDALTDEELNAVEFPVVVKPIDQAGNVGVSYCYDKEQLVKAYHEAKEVSPSGNIIIEKMLQGEELFGYYVLAEGEASLMMVEGMYAQPGQPKNRYSVETTSCNHINHYIEEINDHIIRVLKHIGCTDGVAWVQAMLDSDGHFYLVEMGYRMASDLVFIPFKRVGHFDLVKWMVDYSMGKKWTAADLPKSQSGPFKRCACSYMLWNSREGTIGSIEGLDEVAAMDNVVLECLRYVGDELSGIHPLVNILFDADDSAGMCAMIQKINDTVRITDDKGENLIIYYDDFAFLNDTYEKNMREPNVIE